MPAQSLATLPANQGSERGVLSDIMRDASGFQSFLQSRGEGQGLQFLAQFLATGGASFPQQLAGLWGQYVQQRNQPQGGGQMMQGGGQQMPGMLSLYGALNMPVMMPAIPKVINSAPKGYVIVTNPITGQKVAVLKEVARKLRLWKPAAKPPITAAQMRAIRVADRVRNKVKNINSKVGYVVRSRKTA